MKKSLVLVGALSAATNIGGPSEAFAGGLVVPGGPTVLDGSISIQADSITPPTPSTTEAVYRAALEPNRSYACTVIGESTLTKLGISSVADPSSNPVTVAQIGNFTPVLAGQAATGANNRISLTPSGTGTQTAGEYSFGVDNETTDFSNHPIAANARFDCVETTIYGGYNTNVNDFNFLELLNISNRAISGQVTATNADGTVVINRQAFTVQPNRRADIDIHTPAGPNKYGLIQVTHSGAYGGLQGFVSQYDGTVSSFQLTASIPLRTRDK